PEILKKAEEFKKTIENDIYTLNNKINETIDVYKIVLGLSNEKVFEIKKEVIHELLEKVLEKTISLEEIKACVYKKINQK
ncbi:MAG: hypothetical protein ACRDAQ_08545, partial [Cetobacterium sp.]